ncbi:MAG: CDP-diacylglycerol--glycerol-3-phosphate 3-phosphatidyltransferase [Firmicutes bacterium]|nr:CDP-diacylglycerol--glycerol-3-phosphate 3-phosphatidyltransferase [Bacillota bacterium]
MLNVPNILTLLRLLLIPVITYVALGAAGISWLAAPVFGIAALTDWLDGIAARKLNQVTEFGKIFDPVVDRIFIASVLLILYIKISSHVPLWAILIVIGRDLVMVLGWVYIANLGKRIRVTYEGKLATAVLMLSAFILLINVGQTFGWITKIGVLLFYVGVALSLKSGLNYLKVGIAAIRHT